METAITKPQHKEQKMQLKNISIPSCIKSQNEGELVVYERNLSITKSLKCLPLRNLKQKVNGQILLTSVVFLVMRSSKTSAVYKELDKGLAVNLAVDLLEKFDYDSFEDIVLMFKYARQGKLQLNEFAKKKSFYETVLNDWLPSYLDLKAQEREQIRLTEKESQVSNSQWSEKSKKYLRELRSSLIVKEKTKNTIPKGIHNNEDSYKKYLKKNIKNISTYQLKRIIVSWCKFNDKKRYVQIFVNEIKSRK